MMSDKIYKEDELAREVDENEKGDVIVSTGNAVDLDIVPVEEEKHVKHDLGLVGPEDDIHALESRMSTMSLERTFRIVQQLYAIHLDDHNFPRNVLDNMATFLADAQAITDSPEKHLEIIHEMKMEALLSTENSPYLEVRANVEPTDDPDMPVLTFRVIVIGTVFSAIGPFVDTLFGFRNPPVNIATNVGQIASYPVGKLMEYLPTRKFKLFGRVCSLNPGPFNKKEHMLITIMANVSFQSPYMAYIAPTQALPMFFNEPWARNFGYQFLNGLATSTIGYGIAGISRRFLVWPSFAIWPGTLSVLGLSKAFHTEGNEAVRGPFGTWHLSRQRFFLYAFLAMFVWYFFPGFIWQGLSLFSWMTWIAPENADLDTVTGFIGGMGLNPWPTFDWNNLSVWLVPLTIPTFAIMNQFGGILIGAIMTLIIYYKNAWNTGYLPINGNGVFDNTGGRFNVTKILDAQSQFVDSQYQNYSQPWMSAGFISSYLWYFALYSATFTYVAIFHYRDLAAAYRSFVKEVRKVFKRGQIEHDEDDLAEDVHYKIMSKYKDVPEWQYGIVLLVSVVLGMVGVGVFPTNTSPVVVVFGIIMPVLCLIPCGLIQAVTGIPIPLNVLAEFIGGALQQGNANGLMFFKTYGYITVYQAIAFANDLKLAHYTHIPPRMTFYAQLWATLIMSAVSASVLNFAMSFKDVCTPEAQFRFTCPNQRTFYAAAVFWGTISPNRLFGKGSRYSLMLLGFPLGFLMVIAYWAVRRKYPRSEWLRQIHPVMIAAGPSTWGSPYNMSYFIGNVYVTLFSFQYIRKKFPAFWSKYNYVLAGSFPAGIAIASLVIFFGLTIPKDGNLSIDWWGNNIVNAGCEGNGGCPYLTVEDGGYFGDAPGSGTFV